MKLFFKIGILSVVLLACVCASDNLVAKCGALSVLAHQKSCISNSSVIKDHEMKLQQDSSNENPENKNQKEDVLR